MTANKLKVAGAAAAVVLVGAAVLTLHQQDGLFPAASGPATRDAAAESSSTHPAKQATGSHKGGDKPLWRSLTPAQQVALQPLQAEWDQMDGVRKQKWLQLANRFATLQPAEQQRVQERMRAWAKLTPEQRELARETYTRTRKIAPEQKNASGKATSSCRKNRRRNWPPRPRPQVAARGAVAGQRQGRRTAGPGRDVVPGRHGQEHRLRRPAVRDAATAGARPACARAAAGQSPARNRAGKAGAGQLGHHPEQRLRISCTTPRASSAA
jgi:hypothetical protein